MWMIFYGDGSTFSSEDGSPQESPEWGAVLVIQTDVPGMDTLSGQPYFVHRWDLNLWLQCDFPGLVDQMVHFSPAIDCVRVGRWTTSMSWKEICRRAREALS